MKRLINIIPFIAPVTFYFLHTFQSAPDSTPLLTEFIDTTLVPSSAIDDISTLPHFDFANAGDTVCVIDTEKVELHLYLK